MMKKDVRIDNSVFRI